MELMIKTQPKTKRILMKVSGGIRTDLGNCHTRAGGYLDVNLIDSRIYDMQDSDLQE